MAIERGTRIGKYEVRSLLGVGGMGEVYLAHDPNLHRSVAVKVLPRDLAANQARLERLKREALAASSLNHPNILTIHEICHESTYDFIVTEFIAGISLRQHLKGGALELTEALAIAVQISAALAAAQSAGVIHRDIKPDNVMLRPDGVVKVLDFGLAKVKEEGDLDGVTTEIMTRAVPLTMPGAVMGTAKYMSPEQARGLPVDARTDVWSLGVVLYEMVTGNLPFSGVTLSDVIASVIKTEPSPLSKYLPGAPDELQRIVTKALRKDIGERYSSAKDLEQDLKALRHRLDFEEELERSGGTPLKRSHSQSTGPLTGAAKTNASDSSIQSASRVEYLLNILRRNKPAFSLIALIGAVLAISAAYFAYSRWYVATSTAFTSIAVLPLTNTSKDPEQEYLSDGISESLINRISQLPGLKVIANSSSLKYKGGDADPMNVANELNVATVLKGRILRQGKELSISVELIDARDRTLIWGEQYRRPATDLLAIQADISRDIAEKLKLRLTVPQQQKIAAHEEQNSEAYELLLKGRFHHYKGDSENRKRALEYFNKSIELDPGYALAYAELSNTYRALIGYSVLNPQEYLPKAEAAAQKALELDETLADAHNALANVKAYRWDWQGADMEFRRALELNPNLAIAHRYYAVFLSFLGRNEQAVNEITRTRELDPLSLEANTTLGFVLCNARQYDEGIDVLNRTIAMERNHSGTYWFLGYCYPAKQMYKEAIEAFEKAIELGQNTPGTQIRLGAAYAHAGDRARAETILKQLQTSKEYVSPLELAILYIALGERDEAFASIKKAFNERDLQIRFLNVSHEFDSVRSDSRFQDYLRRAGLAS